MPDLSIIIPSRRDPYLQRTIDDVIEKAHGAVEIIAILDGYWPDSLTCAGELVIVHTGAARGMRPIINTAARIAHGKYLMKCDAHCCFAPGFDQALMAAAAADLLLVPRRYDLDVDTWTHKLPYVDQMYISPPEKGFKGRVWDIEQNYAEGAVVDLMTFQGSCWFMPAALFEKIGGEDEQYGTSGKEAQELGNKVWLSGGRVARHTGTWYAHHSFKRTYKLPQGERERSRDRAIEIWTHDLWPKQTRKFQWLIDKFNPPGWKVQKMEMTDYIADKITGDTAPFRVQKFKRRHLAEMLGALGLQSGAEVGVAFGRYSKILCECMPGLKLICVDPWEVQEDDPRHRKNHNQNYADAAVALKPYDATLVKARSMDAVRDVPPASLDFVYIDGNHTFDAVMMDIIEWAKRVKPGGIVAGHDYYKFRQAGVIEAVDAYVSAHKIKHWYLTDEKAASWWWRKPA